MVHTVGIAGVNGNVGAATAKALVSHAEAGKIKVIIFNRTGSTAKGLSAGENIEFRELNFEDPSEKIEAAVKGVNVFVSAVAFGGLNDEPRVVEALAKSPDLITYIPSVFSTTWEEADYKDPQMAPILTFLHQGLGKAKELGVGTTPFFTGVFDKYFFEYGFVGSPLKGNVVWANEKQLKNRVPITETGHLGSVIARIAASDPQSIKNREYSVVTFWPSGQELVDLYTKLNGKQATIKDWNKTTRDEQMADGANFGPAKAGYWDRWENDSYRYAMDGRSNEKSYIGPSLEEIVRQYL